MEEKSERNALESDGDDDEQSEPTLSNLLLCAGVQFSRNSMRALNDRMNIPENRGPSKVYGNWAGSANEGNFLVCLHGKFQPCQPGLNTRKKKEQNGGT